jgi:arylsulfatase A-like enzyme
MRLLSYLPLLGYVLGEPSVQVPLGLPETPNRPNIVFILTDDQDYLLNSLDYTPLTRKYLIEEGTLFSKHFCTVALCCPSRVSLWTGKAAHNTNVTDVAVPYGWLRHPKLGRHDLTTQVDIPSLWLKG